MERVLIVEDDVTQYTALQQAIQNRYPEWDVRIATTFADANAALSTSLKEKTYFTLFLLDIQLTKATNNQDGLRFAGLVREQSIYYSTPILFLTGLSQYIREALANYHCYNYISKPYDCKDVLHQLANLQATGYLQRSALTFTDTHRLRHHVAIDDIYYIISRYHTITYVTTMGEFKSREGTLDTINQKEPHKLIRCHSQYLVNSDFISDYDRTNNFLRVHTHTIPVGRTYKKNLADINTSNFEKGADL